MSGVIKFRGLNAYGEFVYGLPSADTPNSTHYYSEYSYRICWLPETGGCANQPIKNGTLGQFTGLLDINGVEIYEGDIVYWGHISGFEEYTPRKAVVEFSPDLTFSTFNLERNHKFRFGSFAYRNTKDAVEVIGNIHQNKELLNQG
jgi:uncharacterized phage protein (TIGR01671 family)